MNPLPPNSLPSSTAAFSSDSTHRSSGRSLSGFNRQSQEQRVAASNGPSHTSHSTSTCRAVSLALTQLTALRGPLTLAVSEPSSRPTHGVKRPRNDLSGAPARPQATLRPRPVSVQPHYSDSESDLSDSDTESERRARKRVKTEASDTGSSSSSDVDSILLSSDNESLSSYGSDLSNNEEIYYPITSNQLESMSDHINRAATHLGIVVNGSSNIEAQICRILEQIQEALTQDTPPATAATAGPGGAAASSSAGGLNLAEERLEYALDCLDNAADAIHLIMRHLGKGSRERIKNAIDLLLDQLLNSPIEA